MRTKRNWRTIVGTKVQQVNGVVLCSDESCREPLTGPYMIAAAWLIVPTDGELIGECTKCGGLTQFNPDSSAVRA